MLVYKPGRAEDGGDVSIAMDCASSLSSTKMVYMIIAFLSQMVLREIQKSKQLI